MIPFLAGDGLDALDGEGKKVIGYLWNNYSDGAAAVFTKTAGIRIGLKVHLFGQIKDPLLCRCADLPAIPQGAGDRGYREVQLFCELFKVYCIHMARFPLFLKLRQVYTGLLFFYENVVVLSMQPLA